MSTALTATAKLQVQYVVTGLAHKLVMYMAYNDVLGQHQMVDRDGITTVLWTLGAQYVWDKVRACIPAANCVSAPSVTLLHRSGSFWSVVDVATLTGIGSSGSAWKQGNQTTWVVRDTSQRFMRFEIFESGGDYVGKYPTGQGAGTPFNAITDMLTGADTNANAPFRWMKSRGDRFIAASGQIAGLKQRPNNKICAARGI